MLNVRLCILEWGQGGKTNQDLYTIFPAEHTSAHNRPEGLSNNKSVFKRSFLFVFSVCLSFYSYFSILNITPTAKSNRAWTIKVNSKLSIGIIFCIMFSAIYTFRFQILHEYCRPGSTQNFPHSGFTSTCCVNKCCSIKERCNLMTDICYVLITFINHWEGSENA